MEINTVLSVLRVEALLALLVLIIVWYFRRRSKHQREFSEIERFVEQVINEDALKSQMLQTFLLEKLGADQQRLTDAAAELGATERALMQRVIQMFLERDPSLLKDIDRLLAGLSDQYCQLLADYSANPDPVAGPASEPVSTIDQDLNALRHENRQLKAQLELSLQTMDEITSEYTRVFSGNQSSLELENSSKRMLQIFRNTESHIKNNFEHLAG